MDTLHKQMLLHSQLSNIETALYLIPTEYLTALSDKEFKALLLLRSRLTEFNTRLCRDIIKPKL